MPKVTRYLATLPERTVRAAVAVAGGAVRETAEVALPRVVRGSRLYQATVARLLRILVEGVGGVRGVYPAEAMPVGELTKRKAAGNVVELASVAAVGFSPLWLLAAASDVMGGSKAYLGALVAELEAGGLLPAGTDVASFDELLSRLEAGSGTLADAVDVPPLNLGDAHASWQELRTHAEAADLPSGAELDAIFDGLQEAARREGRSLAELSAAIGLAAGRAGLKLGNVHIFDYYGDALGDIAREGLLTFLRRIGRPYGSSVARHFDPAATTYTDRLLGWVGPRLPGRDRAGDQGPPAPPDVPATPDQPAG